MSIPAEFLAHRLADMARNGPTSTWRDDVRDAAIELERLDAWKREANGVVAPVAEWIGRRQAVAS